MISTNRRIKIIPSARRHLADPIEPTGPMPWPTSYKKGTLGIKLFPQLPSFLPVQLTTMSSMSSLSRERELPNLTGFFFFQTMLPPSIIVCYHWSKFFEWTLKDVADFQDKKEEHLISYSYSSEGPSNKTTWKAECKSGIFFLDKSKIPRWNYFLVAGAVKGTGVGDTKIEAKQNAAGQALEVS